MASKIAKFFIAAFAYGWFLGITALVLSAGSETAILSTKIQHSSDLVLGTGFVACLVCFYLLPAIIPAATYLFGPFAAAFFSIFFPSVWLVMAVPPLASLLILAVLREKLRKA